MTKEHREPRGFKAIWLIHLLCFILLLATVYTGYRYSRQEYFLDAVKGYDYENTTAFHNSMARDLRGAMQYAELEARFETDGMLDFEKTVQTLTDEHGHVKEYSLQNAIDYGIGIGVYFDDDNNLIVAKKKNPGDEAKISRTIGESDLKTKKETGKAEEWWSEEKEKLEQFLTEEERKPLDSLDSLTEDSGMNEKTMMLSLLYQLSEYYEYQRYFGINEQQETSFRYRIIMQDKDGQAVISTNAAQRLTMERLGQYGKFFSFMSDNESPYTNLNLSTSNQILYDLTHNSKLENKTYEVMMAVDTKFAANDHYQQGHLRYEQFVRLLRLLLGLAVVIGIGLIISLGALIVQGRTQKKQMDQWYSEFIVLAMIMLSYVIFWGINEIVYGYRGGFYMDVITGEVLSALAYVPWLMCLLSIVRKRYHHTLASGFMLYRVWKGILDNFRKRNDQWTGRAVMIIRLISQLISAVLMALLVWLLDHNSKTPGIVVLVMFLLWNFLYLGWFCRWESQRISIFDRLETMADGEIGQTLDESQMIGELKRVARMVNRLDHSLEKALMERTRSERMKTELIANVSHDLRTPLTSIINYVDLLKRENIPNERVQEYLDVLDNKAQRMKSMAEALMDASRAASGTMKIQWERIDMVQMLSQALGEFQERFEEKNLEVMVQLVPPPAMVLVDGKILWRVLDNLYTNICKYAKPGTKVNIDLKETNRSLILTVKNVSAAPLNIPADELTERFIRGDVSRSTEGSGLGLSIAKSMTEQLHGKFELFVDGAIFRVRLVFPLVDDGIRK